MLPLLTDCLVMPERKKITAWECPPEIAREVADLDGVLFEPEPAKDYPLPNCQNDNQ